MPIDFPSTPLLDDEVTLAGVMYKWNGQGWLVKGGSGGAPPSSDIWVDVAGDTMTGPLIINPPGVDGLQINGVATQGQITAIGSSPDVGLHITTKGGGGNYVYTGNYANLQAAFTHQTTAGYLSFNGGDGAGVANIALLGGASGNRLGLVNADLIGPTNAYGDVKIEKASALLQLNGINNTILLDSGGTSANYINGAVNGSIRWIIQPGDGSAESGSNTGNDFAIFNYNDAGSQLGVVPLKIIRADGNVLFGQSITLGAAPNAWGNSGYLQVTNSGWQPNGGVWFTLSDARIKTVLGDYTGGLAEILQINPVRYQYKGNDTLPVTRAGDPEVSPHAEVLDKEYIGLVAQDVEGFMPEMIGQRAGVIDGAPVSDLRTFDGNALTYALINAVKELSAANEALTARVAALEGAA